MAFSPFGRGREGDPATEAAPPASSGGALTAFMDQGSEFEGKLSFKDTVRIDGTFRGEISSENTLIVGETGDIEATIRSQTVVVSGQVTGDVFAGRKLVLHKTARLVGAVETPSLVVEEGATLDGPVKMMKAGAPARPAKANGEPSAPKGANGAVKESEAKR